MLTEIPKDILLDEIFSNLELKDISSVSRLSKTHYGQVQPIVRRRKLTITTVRKWKEFTRNRVIERNYDSFKGKEGCYSLYDHFVYKMKVLDIPEDLHKELCRKFLYFHSKFSQMGRLHLLNRTTFVHYPSLLAKFLKEMNIHGYDDFQLRTVDKRNYFNQIYESTMKFTPSNQQIQLLNL